MSQDSRSTPDDLPDDLPADLELRARLRAADPAAGMAPADPEEVDRLLERVVTTDLRETGTRHRNRLTWLVAAAAVVVIGVGATLWARQLDDSTGPDGAAAGPSVGGGASEGVSLRLTVAPTASGRCLMPTPKLLADKPLAFAGRVLGVAGGTATLRPTTVYAGTPGDEVTVTAAVAPDTGGTPQSDPSFVAGEDYLVVADGGQVVGCGFSGPATPDLQRLYDEAFAR